MIDCWHPETISTPVLTVFGLIEVFDAFEKLSFETIAVSWGSETGIVGTCCAIERAALPITLCFEDAVPSTLDCFFLGFLDRSRYAYHLEDAWLIRRFRQSHSECQSGPNQAVMIPGNPNDGGACCGREILDCGERE